MSSASLPSSDAVSVDAAHAAQLQVQRDRNALPCFPKLLGSEYIRLGSRKQSDQPSGEDEAFD